MSIMSKKVSSNDDVRYQLRSDLDFADYNIGDQRQVVVKDRLRFEYFFFQSMERMALRILKKPQSISQLKSKIDDCISPARIEIKEAEMFVASLWRDNLLVSDGPAKIGVRKAGSNSIAAKISSLLAVRFRGINPRWILNKLNPYTKWLFTPASCFIAVFLFVAAMIGLALNASTVFANQFLLSNLARPEILLPLGLAIIVTKTLHELGHALACRAIGRDCHEIGLMFLAFMPCLYCNVSDVWMEPNRWKRIMVSGAGIFVEMLIAAACVPLFLWCRPGSLQLFFFSLIVVSSISTLFVNGNPLLKYDGYYMFSDLLELPNMSGAAQSSWLENVFGFFLYPDSSESKPNSWWLSLYGVMSFLYRCVVLAVIVWVVYTMLDRWQLGRFAWLLAMILAMAAASQTIRGISSGVKQLHSRRGGFRPARSIGCLVMLGVLLLAFFAVPFSSRVFSRGKVVVAGNAIVYAPGDGQIDWHVSAGDAVVSEQLLATVSNQRLDEELLVKTQEIERIKLALRNQQVLLRQGANNEAEIELLMQSLTNARKLKTLLLDEQTSFEIMSGVAGVVQPYPAKKAEFKSSLVNQDVVGFAKRGQPLATITGSSSCEVELDVPESDAKFLTIGDRIRMDIEGSERRVFIGKVAEVGLKTTSKRPVSAMRGEVGPTSFVAVRVAFEAVPQVPETLRLESKVAAVILGRRKTLFQMLLHRLRSNFKI